MQLFRNLAESFRRPGIDLGRAFPWRLADRDMPKFIVMREVPLIHRIELGIEAMTAEAAVERARRASRAGTLWDDTAAMPLLKAEFEEVDADGLPDFEAREVRDFPMPDPSVAQAKCEAAAWSLLRFVRMIDDLCDDDSLSGNRYPCEIPADHVRHIRQLLRQLDVS